MAPPVEKSPEAFRTISEVADWLGVPAHVLRFWESKFPQVKPVKRAGGRRYFRPSDMRLLGGIRVLLHDDGMTIKAVQKKLSEEGVAGVAELSPPYAAADGAADARPGAGRRNGAGAETAPQAPPQTPTASRKRRIRTRICPRPSRMIPTRSRRTTRRRPRRRPRRPTTRWRMPQRPDDAPPEAHAAPETAEPEAPSAPPAAPALPPLPDLPDDPPDDMAADPGTLSRLAALSHPVPRARAERLATLAARLRQTGGPEA